MRQPSCCIRVIEYNENVLVVVFGDKVLSTTLVAATGMFVEFSVLKWTLVGSTSSDGFVT